MMINENNVEVIINAKKVKNLKIINDANKVTLDGGSFLQIEIDKRRNVVTELKYCGKISKKDVTNEIMSIAGEYTLGDIVIGTPYNLGQVVAHILNRTVNRKCVKMLKCFDHIILE